MVQELRAVAILAEGLCCLPRTHRQSQLSITPVPRALMLSSVLYRYQAHIWCTYIHVGEHSYNQNKLSGMAVHTFSPISLCESKARLDYVGSFRPAKAAL